METLTPAEVFAFLSHPARTAKLATVRADGRPHVAPIWFELEGGPEDFEIIFTTWHSSVKGLNLARHGQAALCVDDEQPPYAYVIVEGTVQVEENAAELRRWTTQLAAKYMGASQADAYGARNAVPGELLVRLTPTKILAARGISD